MGDFDRVAVVTGGARGIGKAINERFAADGYRCVVHYRRDDASAQASLEKLRSTGADPLLVKADLGDEDGVRSLFEAVRAEFGRIDVFVASAASSALRSLLDVEVRHSRRIFDQAVVNFILSTQLAAELMTDGGRIISISGLQSHSVIPGYGLLGPAKAATEELVKHLAVELGPRGITVNSVIPGFIETDSAKLTLGADYESSAQRLESCIPIGRRGRPADVADLVSFLASPSAGFITGESIVIDGGMSVLGVPSIVTRLGNPAV
jgi:enoyl-[acyl-carrier protein] reductase III